MRQFHEHRMRMALASLAFACASGATLATPPADEPPPASFGQAKPVDQLQNMTGGSSTTNNINEQTLNATMSDTEAKRNISGGNVVSGSAFGNAAGLPTVIQNSGNNVIIQNSTIVNVRMNP